MQREIRVDGEVVGAWARFIISWEGDAPVEGATVNVLTPAGNRRRVSPERPKGEVVGAGPFTLVNEALGEVALIVYPERTLYPGNVYIYTVSVPPYGPERVVRCEVAGWERVAGAVEGSCQVVIPENRLPQEENDDAS